MSIEVKMPALSPTMEKGTLARWLVQPGDTIRAGDLIAEIETDKATMEMEASEDGVLAQVLVSDGSADVAVGTILALLAEDGETVETGAAKAPIAGADKAPEAVAPEAKAAEPTGAPASQVIAAPLVIDGTARATPLARRIAAAQGIALDGIAGSGPKGRVVLADLGLTSPPKALAAAGSTPAAAPAPLPAASTTAASAPPPAGVPVTSEPLSTMRKTIARRLTESKQTVPHFYLTARCNLDPLMKLRGELNDSLAGKGIKLSVNDLLIKALALALGKVPEANVQFGGDQIHRFARADIAMAVAIEGGLVTPVIRDAGNLSLSAIASESKRLADKAREGRMTPEDYTGGTASISNLGMFGIDEMFPVINPPQAMIMGIGAGIRQPWNVAGQIELATVMAATASFDHRAIDGATAAQLMAQFREIIEAPMLLIA